MSGVTRTFEALPAIVYTFFAVRYVASNDVPALELIALFSMGIPGFVALMQVFLKKTVIVDEPLRMVQ